VFVGEKNSNNKYHPYCFIVIKHNSNTMVECTGWIFSYSKTFNFVISSQHWHQL